MNDLEPPKFSLFRTIEDTFHKNYRYWFSWDIPDTMILDFNERRALIQSVRRSIDRWIMDTYGDKEIFSIIQNADRIIVATTFPEAAALFKMSYG